MGKRLVLVGAGHAHMTVMVNLRQYLRRGHEVVVVGPGDRHYYSGMGPGMLGGAYSEEDISFPVREMVKKRGGAFVKDKVVKADPGGRTLFLESGKKLRYDVVSFNTGSHVPLQPSEDDCEDVYSVKPIENLLAARLRIQELAREKDITVAVVGGGPGALEVAGNAWAAADQATRGTKRKVRIQILAGRKFMARHSGKVRSRAVASLASRGIEIVEEGYAKQVGCGAVMLDSGQVYAADVIFTSPGIKPSTLFAESKLSTGKSGGLLVDKYLKSPDYPEVFGGGDCIDFQDQPLDKVGVYAVRQNPVLHHNLLAALEGGKLKPFNPGGAYLLVYNLGDGTGILSKWGMVFGGALAWRVKDSIDRKFMIRFKTAPLEGF